MQKKAVLYVALLCFCFATATAQNSSDSLRIVAKLQSNYYIIHQVTVTGNKKTRLSVINRESLVHRGDTVLKSELPYKLTLTHTLLLNTRLFSEISVTADSSISTTHIQVLIALKEKWYIYPTVEFKLIDRSISEWVKLHNADLKRVTYGVNFRCYNLTGRRDQLKAIFQTGYRKQLALTYSNPYSNIEKNQGFSAGLGYSRERELGIATTPKNKLLLYNTNHFITQQYAVSGSFTKRKGYFTISGLRLSAVHYSIFDHNVFIANPNYLGGIKKPLWIIDVDFTKSYANVDNNNFPLVGTSYGFGIGKRGFGLSGGINNVSVSGHYKFMDSIGSKKWYYAVYVAGTVKLPFKQAYINQRALTSSEYGVRGLEYYQIDGVASAVAKFTITKQLFHFSLKTPFKLKTLSKIPFTFYGSAFTDYGYAYLPHANNYLLNNNFLYSGGVGLSVLTVYGVSVNINVALNQLGEKVLFLNGKSGF